MKNKKQKTFNVFDIETVYHNENFISILICLMFKKKSYVFINKPIDSMLDLLFNKNKNKTTTIYAHNLTFDGLIILNHISKKKKWFDVKIDGLFLNGNIYILTLELNKKILIFKCSFRLYNGSLSSANKKLLTNEKLNFDHKKINIKNYKTYLKELIKYCKEDVKVTYQILTTYWNFFKRYDNMILSKYHTISGISFNLFLKYFNEHNININLDKLTDKIIREAYYGGRCEVFGNPMINEYIYHFDFKGMYAQIMCEMFGHGKIIPSLDLSPHGFYYVKFNSNLNIPLLPSRSESGKLIFKNGKGEGLYYGEMLILFLEHGGEIEKIEWGYVYTSFERVFENFSKHFTWRRDEGVIGNTLGKTVINGFYGRLGMNDKDTTTKIITQCEHYKFLEENFENIISEQDINNIKIIKIKKNIDKVEFLTSNVLYAASITSKAQIKLFKGFMDVINNNGRLLYCDTDSIFASFIKNIDNEKHGEIEWDEKTYTPRIVDAVFALPKAYGLSYNNKTQITKIKGVKLNTIDFEVFKDSFYNNKQLETLTTSFKKSNYKIKIEDVVKMINLNKYDKRQWIDNTKKNTKSI